MIVPRRTLASSARVEGLGLFSGAAARVDLLPSGEGLVFEADGARVPATIASVDEARSLRNTTLRVGERTIATVEHLMSALAAMGITDATIRVEGPELPLADACASPWVDAIARAGVSDLGESCEALRPARVTRVERDGAWIEAEPCGADEASWECTIDYAGVIPSATAGLSRRDLPMGFVRGVAPARTFCLRAEAEALRAAGLGLHLTDQDVLVFDERGGGWSNPLRFPDEPARHKLLDLIGDLALLGRPLAARVRSHRGGHALTRALVRSLAG